MDQKINSCQHKVPLHLVPLSTLKGPARVFQYGGRKYEIGNYYASTDDEICNRYMGALLRHACAAQNPYGTFDLESTVRLDEESGLPQIDHMICGLLMLRGLLIKRGALPEDPGEGNPPPSQR